MLFVLAFTLVPNRICEIIGFIKEVINLFLFFIKVRLSPAVNSTRAVPDNTMTGKLTITHTFIAISKVCECLIDSDNAHRGHVSSNRQTYRHSNEHLSFYSLSESIKTSIVTSNAINVWAMVSFPVIVLSGTAIVLLTAGDNLTFTKKSKQVNNFLDESNNFINSIRYQGEC